MNRNLRWLAAGLALSGGAWLLLGRGEAGGDRGPWQSFLPKEVYQELAKREADILREQLGGTLKEKAVSRAKLGAVLIAALTMSVKDGVGAEELRGNRETALHVADAINAKNLAGAKQLAAILPNGKANTTAKESVISWGSYLQPADLMDHFDVKTKGGDGMHADLQSNIRLKGALNGIEEKIRALAMKELPAAGLKKEAKELELLGYRTAVVGELAYYYAPKAKAGKKDPQEWQNLSLQMRDRGRMLAVAAQKGDAAAILKASDSLGSTCTQCHNTFK
jgi:hypothetical protein